MTAISGPLAPPPVWPAIHLLLQKVTSPRFTLLNDPRPLAPPPVWSTVHLRLQKVTRPRFTILNGPRAPPGAAELDDPSSLTAWLVEIGLYPIVTFQYSSTTSYQVPYHIRYLLF
jgi:hypothetical protein